MPLGIFYNDLYHSQVVEAAAREGAKLVEKWFVGSSASHVVCEGTSVQRYLGHSSNLVTVSPAALHFFLFVWMNVLYYLHCIFSLFV